MESSLYQNPQLFSSLMDQNNSSSQSQRQSNNSSQDVSYFTSSSQQKRKQPIIIESSSKQVASQSQSVYGEYNKKNKKKKKHHLKKQIQHKSNQEQYIIKKAVQLQKAAKNCQKINNYFAPKGEDQIQQEITYQNISLFNLNSNEVMYLNKYKLPKGLSLQNVQNSNGQTSFRSKISFKQNKLSKYLIQCIQGGDKKQIKKKVGPSTYSVCYHFIKKAIKELRQSQTVPEFFKKNINEIMSYEGSRRYYYSVMNDIDDPLDLNKIERMVENENIKNYIEFQSMFDDMILNSLYIHTNLRNEYLIEESNRISYMLQQIFMKQFCPGLNEKQKSSIKTNDMQKKPKIKKMNLQGEDEQIQHMDLDQLTNKHRFNVMNHFLYIVCQKTQSTLYAVVTRIQNLIKRYPHDKVDFIKKEETNKQLSLKDDESKQYSRHKQYVPKSPRSTKSDNTSNSEFVYYELIPKQISINLFHQLKELIKVELRQRRKEVQRGYTQQEIIRNSLYPHEDSADFDIDDDSYYD